MKYPNLPFNEPVQQLMQSFADSIAESVFQQLKEHLSESNPKTNDYLDKLRTNNEVLDRYQISYSTLRKLRSEEGFPKIKIGTDYRYSFQKLDEWFSK
tara:strand:+ start:504 stop:797 length:294 start_codon:yes stop_codon:yes gene_type:complete